MEIENPGVFVIYSRKSKFTGKGESVENQVEMCRNYLASLYGSEAAQAALVYEDEGFSGGNLERPQFKQMMQDSTRQKFRAIVVYRLDRISRNIGDFANLIEDLGDRNIAFISIREQFDTGSPMGRAMMFIASVFSQLERETIAERIRDNMHELAKTGRWLGGMTPLGYASQCVTVADADGKQRKRYKLVTVPQEIALVKDIYDTFMETGSLTKVDQYLLERRIKTRGGCDFTRYSIRALLSNPVYMVADQTAYEYLVSNKAGLFSTAEEFDGTHGVMAYNRSAQKRGKTTQLNSISEWIVSVGQHPGVIPSEQWIAAQKKLTLNSSKSYRNPRSHVALLSGLLVCGNCGDYMRPKMTNRKNAKGEFIYDYMCVKKERSCRALCSMPNVHGNELDAMVVEAVKSLTQNSGEMARQLLATRKALKANQDSYSAELEQIKFQIGQMDKQTEALVDALSRVPGSASEQAILKRIEALNEQGAGSRKRQKELETILERHQLACKEFELLRQMLSQFSVCFDRYTLEQKRAALRLLIRKIVWDGETAHIYIFGKEGSADLPDFKENMADTADFQGQAIPLCEERKRDPHVLPQSEEAAGRGVPVRPH